SHGRAPLVAARLSQCPARGARRDSFQAKRRRSGGIAMSRKHLVTGSISAVVLALGGYGLYRAGMSAGQTQTLLGARSSTSTTPAPLKPGDIDPQTGKKMLYWHDSMVPEQRFEHRGKSPFMDMPLVPVVEGGTESGAIQISPRLEQNLG